MNQVNQPPNQPQVTPLDTTFLHQFRSVSFSFYSVYDFEDGASHIRRDTGLILQVPGYSISHFLPSVLVQWSGYNFQMIDSKTNWSGTQDSWVHFLESWDYTGSLSDLGLKISGQASHHLYDLAYDYHPGLYEDDVENQFFAYDSIPLVLKTSDSIVFSLKGSGLKSRISNLNDSIGFFYQSSKLTNIIWEEQPAPALTITFYK